jgi:glutaminase
MVPGASEAHELQRTIDALHSRYKPLTDGDVASYIPELTKADPEHFGICIATAEGAVFETGDCDRAFTIQSISKPFTFGMAIEAYGAETVAKYVGVEPSGDVFNSIELMSGSNRPHNPMINAGAITVSALLHARYGDEAFDLILERFSTAAGRQLGIDPDVYESERRTGHRNRAIAHVLAEARQARQQRARHRGLR